MKTIADNVVGERVENADRDRTRRRDQPNGAADDGRFLLGAKDWKITALVHDRLRVMGIAPPNPRGTSNR